LDSINILSSSHINSIHDIIIVGKERRGQDEISSNFPRAAINSGRIIDNTTDGNDDGDDRHGEGYAASSTNASKRIGTNKLRGEGLATKSSGGNKGVGEVGDGG